MKARCLLTLLPISRLCRYSERMGARQCKETFLYRLCQLLRGDGRTRTERHKTARNREEIFDAIIHLLKSRRCCSSARCRSLISRAIFDAPMMRPSAFVTGDTVRETWKFASVLAQARGLEMVDAFSVADAG